MTTSSAFTQHPVLLLLLFLGCKQDREKIKRGKKHFGGSHSAGGWREDEEVRCLSLGRQLVFRCCFLVLYSWWVRVVSVPSMGADWELTVVLLRALWRWWQWRVPPPSLEASWICSGLTRQDSYVRLLCMDLVRFDPSLPQSGLHWIIYNVNGEMHWHL